MRSITQVFKEIDGSSTDSDIVEIAIHEAGHALGHLIVPFASELFYVTIVPEKNKGGHCASIINNFLTTKQMFAGTITSLASIGAVAIHDNPEFKEDFSVESYKDKISYSNDFEHALHFSLMLSLFRPEIKPQQTIDRAGVIGYRLMHRYKRELDKLAQALLVEQTLTGDQVRDVTGIRRPMVYEPAMLLD